jgi:hypothetical protein
VVHDVKFSDKGENIDHIVLGPNGVFVLETKNLGRKTVFVEEEVWVEQEGRVLQPRQPSPVVQVVNQAGELERVIEDGLGIPFKNKTGKCVVLADPKTSIGKVLRTGVKVAHLHEVSDIIKAGSGLKLSESMLDKIEGAIKSNSDYFGMNRERRFKESHRHYSGMASMIALLIIGCALAPYSFQYLQGERHRYARFGEVLSAADSLADELAEYALGEVTLTLNIPEGGRVSIIVSPLGEPEGVTATYDEISQTIDIWFSRFDHFFGETDFASGEHRLRVIRREGPESFGFDRHIVVDRLA